MAGRGRTRAEGIDEEVLLDDITESGLPRYARTTITLKPHVMAALDALASRMGGDRSAVISWLIMDMIKTPRGAFLPPSSPPDVEEALAEMVERAKKLGITKEKGAKS